MKLFKRIAAGVIVIVGTAGVAFTVYAIANTWSTADRMAREVPEAFAELERAVASVHRRGEMAISLLQTTRDQLGSIVVMVDELSHNREDRPFTSVLDRLDTEILERLERAEEFVRSMQSTLESAGGALLLLESMPFLGARVSPSQATSQGDVKSLASNLTEVSKGLEQATRILSEIRTSGTVDPARVAQIQVVLNQVDAYLNRIQSDIEDLSGQANVLAIRLADIVNNSGRWIGKAAALCTLFFVCFGFSQLHLLIHACPRLGVRIRRAGDLAASNPSGR